LMAATQNKTAISKTEWSLRTISIPFNGES